MLTTREEGVILTTLPSSVDRNSIQLADVFFIAVPDLCCDRCVPVAADNSDQCSRPESHNVGSLPGMAVNDSGGVSVAATNQPLSRVQQDD